MHILKRMHTLTCKPAILTYNALNLRSFASGLQLHSIPGAWHISPVRFPIQYRVQRAVDLPGLDLSTFATRTHTCTCPSVRPSVRLASVLAARFGLAYIHAIRALSCGNTCDTCALRAANMPGLSFYSLWSLKSILGSTTRQRKSTAGSLPTVLTMRYVRSLCTRTRLRPSARPGHCCIHVSACSQFAKKRINSGSLSLFISLMARISRLSTGQLNSISSGSNCHVSSDMSSMLSFVSIICCPGNVTDNVSRLPRSKYIYLTALLIGCAISRNAILPDHKRGIRLKNDSVPA